MILPFEVGIHLQIKRILFPVSSTYFSLRPIRNAQCGELLLILSFRRVLNVVYSILGKSPASVLLADVSEVYRFHLHRQVDEEWLGQPSQAKVLTGGGDLHDAHVDVPLSVSHSCV
jgi:hypothetical protein